MSSEKSLVSLYIKDGASKLIEYTESTLNKKKIKKNIAQEQIDYHPSIYNFVVLKSFRPNTSDITNQEILKNIQGKTRSSLLYKNQENVYLKDIKAFQILYNKYLKYPTPDSNLQEQKLMCKNIKTRIGLHIFSPYLQDTQVDQLLLKVGETVDKAKVSAKISTVQVLKQAQKALLVHRSQRQNYQHYSQQQKQRELSVKQLCKHSMNLQQSSQYEQIGSKIINLTIHRWFTQLLEAVGLKDLLNTPKIIVQWPNNFLLQQKEQLLAQQINGKLLFNVEQSIAQVVETTKQLDFAKQFHLRQKRCGIHSNMNHNMAIKNQKDKNAKPNQRVSIVSFEDKAKNNISQYKKMNYQPNPQKAYSQIANRVNNLRRNSGSNMRSVQERQIIEPPNSYASSQSNENSNQSNNYNFKFIQYKKPTPLKYDQLSQYEFKQGPNLKQQQPLNNRLVLKNGMPAEQRVKNTVAKVQVKFPIKIEHFQMNSWCDSFICYKAEEINLKQLPLTFMKDRHKFGQNRVKIEYPCKPQASIVQIVCRSMQILNCFGAEVYCEQQSSYKSINEIDESQILAVSWIIERPVQQVIKYYGQYYGCATKK